MTGIYKKNVKGKEKVWIFICTFGFHIFNFKSQKIKFYVYLDFYCIIVALTDVFVIVLSRFERKKFWAFFSRIVLLNPFCFLCPQKCLVYCLIFLWLKIANNNKIIWNIKKYDFPKKTFVFIVPNLSISVTVL